jgi:ketosteroid isomerase-like protein
MNDRRTILIAAASLATASCASRTPALSRDELVAQLRSRETSFAAAMASRDHHAFASHIADDAVFINGGTPLRGKEAIASFWKRFFVAPGAPFAWRPEIVEVGAEGTLGFTEGPVWAPSGAVFGRFYSTWQRSSSGQWFVVFDNGYDLCKQ